MSLTFGLLAFTWYYVHGGALSRTRKAFFDEANVLRTYQIYNRKYGHLYDPEPPTPGFAALSFNEPGIRTVGDAVRESAVDPNDEKVKFDQAVQQHYGGMYDKVLRVQHEMNLPEQSVAANLDEGFAGNLEQVQFDGPGGLEGGQLLAVNTPTSDNTEDEIKRANKKQT